MSGLPKELRQELSLWVRFHAGLAKTLWCILAGGAFGWVFMWLQLGHPRTWVMLCYVIPVSLVGFGWLLRFLWWSYGEREDE